MRKIYSVGITIKDFVGRTISFQYDFVTYRNRYKIFYIFRYNCLSGSDVIIGGARAGGFHITCQSDGTWLPNPLYTFCKRKSHKAHEVNH